jgi:hypothetical protein
MSANKELIGPISTSRKKADLVDIATALGIEYTGTIRELVPRIQGHLKAHQELVTQSQFQRLFMYRPAAAESKKADSRENGKSSTDKQAEDNAENSKPSAAATGYVKIVLPSRAQS